MDNLLTKIKFILYLLLNSLIILIIILDSSLHSKNTFTSAKIVLLDTRNTQMIGLIFFLSIELVNRCFLIFLIFSSC
jgi:hypothetical protein